MSKIVRVLGATVFSLLMYSVPIILTLSFVYDWDGFYRWIGCIAAVGQFLALVDAVLYKAERGEQ